MEGSFTHTAKRMKYVFKIIIYSSLLVGAKKNVANFNLYLLFFPNLKTKIKILKQNRKKKVLLMTS